MSELGVKGRRTMQSGGDGLDLFGPKGDEGSIDLLRMKHGTGLLTAVDADRLHGRVDHGALEIFKFFDGVNGICIAVKKQDGAFDGRQFVRGQQRTRAVMDGQDLSGVSIPKE